MTEYDLKYPSTPANHTFRLLELPPELCQLIESSVGSSLNLTIKGGPDDDAVLCTADKTYNIRSVVLSNSVLVVSPLADPGSGMDVDGGTGHVFIQDSLNEILELQPAVPKLHRLRVLLRGLEWEEGHEDDEEDTNGGDGKRRRYTYEQAKSDMQASEQELEDAIKAKHILVMDGALRPIAPSYLHTILELLLTYLVSLSQPHQSASVAELAGALEGEHEIRRDVVGQVMRWFGSVEGEGRRERWQMDVAAVVRQVGLGILRHYKDEPISEVEFLRKWRTAVGDTFESEVALPMLSGNYLISPAPITTSLTSDPGVVLTYFPRSALPTDPSTRFTDLFLTRARWKAADISPFLDDIAVSVKERDKLLLKYARALTDAEGVWYTARAR
ncbi:sister chromatid cohesion protein Dcc1 [Amylostereum chailletii]|nr:sister chromatid cohesion protein Dcc1 [Amylostereum chailletii]